MARAKPQQSQPESGPAPDPHEWHALRSELITLLEQVEGRYVRPARPASGTPPIAERMREVRDQVSGPEPESRRREALKSVKRAVDRFNEREEGEAAPEPISARSPRDALESAIAEIRARQQAKEAEVAEAHDSPAAIQQERPQPQAPAPDMSPRFEELAHSVAAIGGRLERLEVELKAQRHDQGSIREIADQVSQVSHVVELLAGAVGETGHVKRLESQIAGLARLISEGQRVDMTALTQRLDDVSATVERLADLQIQHVSREKDMPDLVRRLDNVSATVERLADLQAQHVAREKDLPSLGATLGEVSQSVAILADRQSESIALERQQIPVLGQQLGTVSESVERLVDLQTMHVRSIKDVPAQQEALRAGLHSIEKGVRNVYDRIDTMERTFALPPAEFEKLTAEMARFTQALQMAAPPQSLLELVDVLNSRMTDIESRDIDIEGLRQDLSQLRQSVIDAIEPRMAAIESRMEAMDERGAALAEVAPRITAIQTQLEALGERNAAMDQVAPRIADIQSHLEVLSERGAAFEHLEPRIAEIQSQLETMKDRGAAIEYVAPRIVDIQSQLEALNERVAERPDTSVGQIEAQVRQLVARMDQTGEQLSGLARLYSEVSEREAGPDYEALAEMVAARTSEAVARSDVPVGITAHDMSELEARMSRLIQAVANDAPGAPDISDVTAGIRRVDERLERLESALAKLAEESAAPGAVFDPPAAPAGEERLVPAPAARRDEMPEDPAEDKPLLDKPFPSMGPLRVMLETRIASRRQHPGLDDEGAELSDLAPITPEMLGGAPRSEEAISPNFIPSFDPESVARPPRPSSSLVDAPADAFKPESHPITGSMIDPLPELPPAAPRSTFIEAARRAAQRQQEPEAASSSLIGRALARFQSRAHVETATDQPATTDDATQKPAKKGRRKMALVPSSAVEVPSEIELGAPAAVAQDQATEASADALIADAGRESFLVRHRQPILLAASVVALSFLTLNLIGQRFAEEPVASSIEEASTTPAASAEALLPTAPLTAVTEEAATPTTSVLTAAESIEAAAAEGPRMIPMIDSLATGAIARSATQFSPGSTTPTLPQSFQAPASGAAPAVTPESPVKVELPPEGIGPTELREASAGGDPRAQFEVGAIYTEGRAVPKDLAMAATWYERAAAQGFAPAQYRLANLYENGLGVEKNLEQARLWYQRAAEAGNRMSMHNLAALYAGGELGEQDFLAASEWFEKAANQGLTDSQFNLGMLYARGLGVAQNMETSYKWFALAAARGDKDAATARDDVAKSLEADVVNRLAFEVDAWRPEPIDLTANFAPIGTWSETFDPGEVITARDVVLGVQSILTRLGYDVGTPDGVAGPKTAEAISAFEKAIGMPTSGTINPRLLAVLASQPV